jgi:hypothetical protein
LLLETSLASTEGLRVASEIAAVTASEMARRVVASLITTKGLKTASKMARC